MAKKSPYFSHDFGARRDPQLTKLQRTYGNEGKGIYWDLVEILYEQGGFIYKADLEDYAYELHTPYERITDVLHCGELFCSDEEKYWSERVNRGLAEMKSKSDKAKESIKSRWDSKNNTNVLQPNYEGNTINKEINKEREKEKSLSPFSKNGKTSLKMDWFEKNIWKPWPKKNLSLEEAVEIFIQAAPDMTEENKPWYFSASQAVLNYSRSKDVSESVIMNFDTFFIKSKGANIILWDKSPPN